MASMFLKCWGRWDKDKVEIYYNPRSLPTTQMGEFVTSPNNVWSREPINDNIYVEVCVKVSTLFTTSYSSPVIVKLPSDIVYLTGSARRYWSVYNHFLSNRLPVGYKMAKPQPMWAC